MRRIRFSGLAPIVLALVLVPVTASAAKIPHLSLGRILTAGGGTIPIEWAGVWDTEDTTRTCGADDPEVSTSQDTLCSGDPFGSAPPGFQYDCTGTVTSTTIDVTCTGSFPFGDCTLNITYTIVGTRSGETAKTVETFTQAYDPTGCAFVPDSCEETRSSHTRTGGEPANCSTPTRKSTWGGLKILYR